MRGTEPLPRFLKPFGAGCNTFTAMQVMKYMSASYIRRVRLVCNGWACFAGRFCTELKPEFLPAGGQRLAQRFPYLHVLDLSHCSEIVIHAKVRHITFTCTQQGVVRRSYLGRMAH